MNWSKSFRKTPTDDAALQHALVGDANARRPAPNPAGCPARAHPRHRGIGPGMRLGWSGMTLAIDGRADVQKGRHVLRGGGPVACVMPVVTEFVTLLLADFVTGYPA